MTSRAYKGASASEITSRLRAGGAPGSTPADCAAPVPVKVVHARLATAAVLPASLAVACTVHAVAVGVACFGRTGQPGSGVCAARVMRRSSEVAS